MGSRGWAASRGAVEGRWWQPRSPCWPCWCRPSLGTALVASSSVGTDSPALHRTRCVITITTAPHIQQGREERMKRFATMEMTGMRRGRKKTHWKLEEELFGSGPTSQHFASTRRLNWWPTPMTVTHFTTVTNSPLKSRAVEISCSTPSEFNCWAAAEDEEGGE